MDHEANPAKAEKMTHTHTYIAHQIREIVPRGGAKIINDFFFNLACQKGPCHLRIIFKARIYVFQGRISISFFMYGLRNQKETSSGVKLDNRIVFRKTNKEVCTKFLAQLTFTTFVEMSNLSSLLFVSMYLNVTIHTMD